MQFINIVFMALAGVFLLTNQAYASKATEEVKWYLPNSSKLQYAGNLGFLSLSLGKTFRNERFHLDFFYGYVPTSVGDTDIHTLAIKTAYSPFRKALTPRHIVTLLYLGIGVNRVLGDKFNTEKNKLYPKKYYYNTNLFFTPHIGTRLDFRTRGSIKTMGTYLELGTTGYYFVSYIKNQEFLDLSDITNLALGIVVGF